MAHLHSIVGLERGSSLANHLSREPNLDHVVALEVGDLPAIDPIGLPVSEHRLRRDDAVDLAQTGLEGHCCIGGPSRRAVRVRNDLSSFSSTARRAGFGVQGLSVPS